MEPQSRYAQYPNPNKRTTSSNINANYHHHDGRNHLNPKRSFKQRPVHKNSVQSIDTNTSFIDSITWPIAPLSYRNINDPKYSKEYDDNSDNTQHKEGKTEQSDDSLLSSVDTNELLASPNRLQQLDNRNIIIHQAPNNKSEVSHKQSSGSYHYVETLNTSRSHKLSFDFDEELPALPTSHNSTKSKKSKHKQGNYKKKTTNNSKKKVNVPAVSSYFSNKYYDSMHMDRHHMYSNYNYTPTSRSVPSSSYSYSGDNMTRKTKNNNVVLPLVSIKSSPKTKTRQKHNSQMQVPGNSKRMKRKSMPQTQTQNKSRTLTKKSNKKRKNGNVLHSHSRIPPQIDPIAIDTHFTSPIAAIPPIPNNINDINTKSISCVTYDFDYDSDPIPKPASYRNMHIGNVNNNKITQNHSVAKNLELTKENLERLNANNMNNMYNVTDSTSSDASDGSDELHKLEKIGKQLREISILAAAAQDCSSGDNSSMMVQANPTTAKKQANNNYLVTVTHCPNEKEASDDYDNSVNLSSTDLSPKYPLQATPSTQPDDSIAISSTKYDAKSVNNRRVLPVQSQHLKHVYYKSKRRRKLRNKMKSKQNRKYNDLQPPQQPYINDDGDTYTDHTFSVLLNDVLNDDIISHPNGSGMNDINHIQVYDEEEKKLQLTLKSTNRTSNTVTYADSIELEQKLNFIHANHRSEQADICLYNELEASNRSRSIGVRQLALDLNLQSKKAQHLSAVNDLNHLRRGSEGSNSTIPSLLIPIDQPSDDENECLQLCPTNSPQQHQRQHIRYIHDNDDRHEEAAQANEQKEADAKGYKLAFSLRENSCLCSNIWLIMFHIISIMSYLSQSYIGFIHYKLKGIITYQLICYVCLSVIIFSIYVRMLMKNISFKDYKYLNDGRNNKLIAPSMINCTHFMLQFVIYMLLIVIDGNGMHGWAIIVNNFDMGQVFILVTIIIFQCVCLSMTVINILSYLWEKKHYHRQSLSFRVLCLYLDIIRILVLIYVFWNLSDDNNYNIISSFYYLYFYVEYWLLLILLITVRYILICVNFNSFYKIFGSTSFFLYCTYCLIEPIFRFIIIQLFPHCAVYYMIHNVGTGKFDHYLSKNKNSFLFCTVQIPSIKKIICADIMIGNTCNSIQIPSVSKHFALLAIFEFIENGVYECIENDGFLLSKDIKQEMFRRILTINYQLLMNDTTICGATELYNTNHERLLNLNNIILYEFHKMSQLSMYPLKILRKRNDLYMDNDGNFNGNPSPKMYDDLFQNKDISKSNIFMEWFINNDLMANLHFEWSNDFTVNHPLFTTFICKYIVTLFYIFTRITNICWLYFMINNYILYLFNTQIDNNTKWILIYICAVIIVLHIFAHIVLIIIAIKAYDFERTIWFLLPMLNAKYIDNLLDAAADIKNIVDVYESFCYNHIVSNNLYNNLGYDIGVVIMSYLGHDLSYDTYNLNEKNDGTVIITTDLNANVVDI